MESFAPISMDVPVLVHRDGRQAIQVDQVYSRLLDYAFSDSGMCVSSEEDNIGTGCSNDGWWTTCG